MPSVKKYALTFSTDLRPSLKVDLRSTDKVLTPEEQVRLEFNPAVTHSIVEYTNETELPELEVTEFRYLLEATLDYDNDIPLSDGDYITPVPIVSYRLKRNA